MLDQIQDSGVALTAYTKQGQQKNFENSAKIG